MKDKGGWGWKMKILLLLFFTVILWLIYLRVLIEGSPLWEEIYDVNVYVLIGILFMPWIFALATLRSFIKYLKQ